MRNKLRLNGKRLRYTLIPFIVIMSAIFIAFNICCYYYSYNLNVMFGGGEIKISSMNGSAEGMVYNEKTLGSEAEAVEAMGQFNIDAARESIVLLKNDGALPLADDQKKLNVFGWYFENAPYCAPSSSSSSSVGDYVYPKTALENAGYILNYKLLSEIKDGVKEYAAAPTVGRWSNDWAIPEYIPSDSTVKEAVEFSDTAIIWFTRAGNEGADVPQTMNDNAFYHNSKTVKLSDTAKKLYGYDPSRHYMQLTSTEEKLIAKVTAAGFEKVIVVVNSDNPMELSFVEKNSKINAALLAGGLGFYGFKALPEILSGITNPSGRLADIYAADFKSDPVWVNHGDMTGEEYKRSGIFFSAEVDLRNNVYQNLTPQFIAENGLRTNGADCRFVFQNYEEGIYLGYRYYETSFGPNEEEYRKRVVYPFGHGLSYTSFSQRVKDFSIGSTAVEVEIEVENTGKVAGKETAQLYFTPPYGDATTNANKIEKPEVVLAGFAKTRLLKSGEKQTVKISVDKEQLTSYDDKVDCCYVLDDGEYVFTLRRNSHDIVRDEKGEEQSFVWNNASRIVYGENNPRPSEKYAHNTAGINYRSAVNAFDNTLKGISPTFENMSRADFAATFPKIADETDKTAGEELISYYKKYDISKMNDPSDVMPATGIDSNLQLIDMRGKEYDDPSWQLWLDQWTVDEMIDITSHCGRGISSNTRLGVPACINSDGAMGIKYKSIDYTVYDTILPLNCTACSFARSWNKELFHKFGEICGEEALQFGMNGWYAPALNLHRSPLAGRYFDYCSEDPLICGEYGAEIASGAASKGVVTYIKHFAMNEGEYLRNYCSVWASEQVMRELYLKPFETAIKKSSANVVYKDGDGKTKIMKTSAVHGVMTAFNRVGNTWAGGNADLLQTVLRDEWGFCGIVISDNMRNEWSDMDIDIMLRGGGNISLAGTPKQYADKTSATFVKSLKEAVHGISFAVVNSNAMNGIAPGNYISYGLAPWEKVLISVDVAGFCIIAAITAFLIYRTYDEKKHPERYDKNAVI